MLEYLIDDKFIESSDGIAVGVSGGADSMVLLWALLDKQKEIGFDIHVVNVNHHIRGISSDEDSRFVEEFCKNKKIKCTIVDVDAKKLKADQKLTLEEAARKARYEAFESVMKKEHLNKLFLAHHKNDQVETILMHLFRGSGISGACGICDTDKVFRPLLSFSKADLLRLANEHGIKFVTDESNQDNSYARNYVRNIVIPEIEKMYPNVIDSIFEFGEKCKNVQKFIEKSVKNENIINNGSYFMLKDAIFDEDLLVVREYIKQTIARLGVFADIEMKHYDAVISLKDTKVNTCIDLPHGVVVGRTYQGLKFFKKRKDAINETEYEFVIGRVEIEGVGVVETRFVSADEVIYGEDVLYADYGKISTDAVWRTRRLGDMFAKFGSGSKKLNDYFTDKKIENLIRDKVPILVSANQVMVVAGYDISENVKIDGETEQIVAIKLVR